ncbi:hypothetical protein B0I35DRAFT_429779 [Stachybotrys elegans]|uniref:Uncharacterized protein n=1 Tax=Stachybotrys elegans TaxID=80388 RepID=A0A8K0SR16_9HYPO|nr:hypothetical protein B0I35DRAFT_429779 [Stachybotrys elegans]
MLLLLPFCHRRHPSIKSTIASTSFQPIAIPSKNQTCQTNPWGKCTHLPRTVLGLSMHVPLLVPVLDALTPSHSGFSFLSLTPIPTPSAVPIPINCSCPTNLGPCRIVLLPCDQSGLFLFSHVCS